MIRARTAILIASLALAACARDARYVHPTADLGGVRTVAVLPFENLTSDKLASERVQKIFITELLSLSTFQVVEPGEVLRTVRREQVDPAALTPDDVKKIGQVLKVQAVFVGTVVEYEEGRGGSTPQPLVTLQFRLLETESGSTVWSVSRTRSGATVTARLFGLGAKTASIEAEEIIREELERFVR